MTTTSLPQVKITYRIYKIGVCSSTIFVAKDEAERQQFGRLQPYWGKSITTEAHVSELTSQVGSWLADGRKLISVERI